MEKNKEYNTHTQEERKEEKRGRLYRE